LALQTQSGLAAHALKFVTAAQYTAHECVSELQTHDEFAKHWLADVICAQVGGTDVGAGALVVVGGGGSGDMDPAKHSFALASQWHSAPIVGQRAADSAMRHVGRQRRPTGSSARHTQPLSALHMRSAST
jgi:hypothetical protein